MPSLVFALRSVDDDDLNFLHHKVHHKQHTKREREMGTSDMFAGMKYDGETSEASPSGFPSLTHN